MNEMKAAAKRTQHQQHQQQHQQLQGGYSSDASDLTPNATPRSLFFLDPTMHASLDLASLTVGGSLYSSNINSARASTVDELIEVLQGGGLAESTRMSGRRSIREKIAKLDVDLPSIFGGGAKRQ